MRKRQAALLLLLAAVLTGCTRTEKEIPKEITEQSGQEETEKEEEKQEETNQEEINQEAASGFVRSSIVLEDEEAVYICGSSRLLKWEKKSGKTEVLWENAELVKSRGARIYSEGSGLLTGDSIYFVEAFTKEEDGTEEKALSVIGTDGTGYQRLNVLPDYTNDSMLLADGRLYINAANTVVCYGTDEKGIFSVPEEINKNADYGKLSVDLCEISYQHNGNRTLFAPEARHSFGYYLMKNEYDRFIKVLPETGEEIRLPMELQEYYLQTYNGRYFLFAGYGDGERLYLTDRETLETRLLAEYEAGVHIIAMDEENVYLAYSAGSDARQCVFERISLQNGEKKLLFTDDGCENYAYYTPEFLMDITLYDGYFYYEGVRDYKIYLMRRSLEEPETEERIGEPVFDSRISEVGRLENYYEEIYSQVLPDALLTEIDCKRLVVDEKFTGAAEINRILAEWEKKNININEAPIYAMEEREEWLKEEREEVPTYLLNYSYTSDIYEISYFDGNYLSFCQQSYEYTGGAHGMPYWTGFTFDLQTGQRLSLADIVENSEEEINGIVTGYFAAYINENPDNFWEDAILTVQGQSDFNSRFYLTEEGINFYFEPYALACYAAGFQQVTVPYSEFRMLNPF